MIQVSWTTDPQKIKTVLCDPRIYEVITGDNAPNIEDYEVDLDGAEYVIGEIFQQPVAVMVFHHKNLACWQLHIQVVPEFRKLYASSFADQALKLFWDKRQATLVAEIPTKYQNVVDFALRHGFSMDGKCKDAYLKGGNLYDIVYLSRRPADGLGERQYNRSNHG